MFQSFPVCLLIVLLRSEFSLGSRSVPPHLPIRTHRLGGSGGVFSGAPNAISQTTDGYL
jgi:hypothetical protein